MMMYSILSIVVICLFLSVEMCPDLNLNEVIHVTCNNKEGEVVSCSEAVDYTTLSYKCPKGHKIPDGVKSTIQCLNGSWETPTPECQRVDSNIVKTTKQPMKVVCFYDSRQYYNEAKPEDFNVTLCTHIIYHYAGLSYTGNIITKDGTIDVGGNKSLYESVVAMKNRNSNLTILLSVYALGINENDEFPNVSANSSKRAKFVDSALNLLETYKFDGLDIHWHYPTSMVKENYTILLQETKEALKQRGKLLTITAFYTPVYSGYSISRLNQIVDWIHIKCFDFYDELDKYTGQHSALYASSVENDFQENNLNVQSCIENWRGYGTHKEKLIPTITFFGRYYTLKDANEHDVHSPVTGSTNKNHTGLVSYSEICQNYTNWTRVWDKEQQNPYKYHQDKWLGYDDEESIKLKAAYIKAIKSSGIGIFSIDGDDVHGRCGTKQALLKQVHAGIADDVH